MAKETVLPSSAQNQVKVQSLPEQAYQTIRKAIVSGHIMPGQLLQVRRLARELGVSTGTVHQALNQLAGEGLLESEPYRGFRVAVPTAEDLKDRHLTLCHLAGYAFELAAGRITPDELAHMEQLLPEVIDRTSGPPHGLQADYEFNRVAFQATGRTYLCKVLDQVWFAVHWWVPYVREHYSNADDFAEGERIARKYYTAALEALKAGDGKRAREALTGAYEEDLNNVYKIWERVRNAVDESEKSQ